MIKKQTIILPYLIFKLLAISHEMIFYFEIILLSLTILLLLVNNSRIYKKSIIYLIVGFLMFQIVLGSYSGLIFDSLKNTAMNFLNFGPMIIFFLMIYSETEKTTRITKSIIIFLFLYLFISVFIYMLTSPYAIRNLSSYNPYDGIPENMPKAIGGGYKLIYGIIILPPLAIYMSRDRKKLKCLYYLIAILVLLFIFYSNFTTAFLLSLFFSIISLFIKYTSKIKVTKVAIIIISLICLFSSYEVVSFIVNFLNLFIPKNSVIYFRINEIIPALFDNTSDVLSSFGLRLRGLNKSLETIRGNFLLGVGYEFGYDYMSLAKYTGLHTQWIDDFAIYGFLNGILYFTIHIYGFRELIKKYHNSKYKNIMILFSIMTLVLGLLNPIATTSLYTLIFLVVPLFIENNQYLKTYDKEVGENHKSTKLLLKEKK